jgi:hypothetical protein
MALAFSRTQETPRKGRFSLGEVEGWFGAALLILSWLTTEHFHPWVSWHGEVVAFIAVFSLAWSGVVRSWRAEPSYSIGVPLLALPFVLIGMVALAQFATGIMTFSGDVVAVWFYLALCIACLVIGFNIERASETHLGGAQVRWTPPALLALTLVVGATASVVVAFAQVFELWPNSAWIARMPDLRRPGGNLGQPNQLATLVVMAMASIAFLHSSARLNALASTLILVALCAGMAVSESRAGVLAIGALLAWWQIKRPVVAGHVSRWAGPAVAAMFVVMFLAWPFLLNFLQLDAAAANRFGQADVRLALWSQLLEATLQRPWWGWGMSQVAEAHNAVAHAHPINNPFTYSHNLVLDWAVWFGFPIAMAFLVASAVWLWRRVKMIDRLTPWYCLSVAVPLATHSMLEFPFAYAYFLAPVLFLLGYMERALGAKPLLHVGRGPTSVVLTVLSGVLIWSAVEYLSIEEDFRIVRFEQLRIGRTSDAHHRPDVVLFTQLGTLLTGSRIELRPGMQAEELEQLKKLALRYPWVATQYRYAVALALNGDQGEAVRQLQVLRWQRGEQLYARVKSEMAALAQDRYPQLSTLILP